MSNSRRENLLNDLVQNHPVACILLSRLLQAIDTEKREYLENDDLKENYKLCDLTEDLSELLGTIIHSDISSSSADHSLRCVWALLTDLESKGVEFDSKLNNITFTLYSDEAFKSISVQELIDDDNCLARVELSGSEGFYVEVVRCLGGKWYRYAHKKCFEVHEAELLSERINNGSRMTKIFHCLPSYPETTKAEDVTSA